MIRNIALAFMLLCLPTLAAAKIGISQVGDMALPTWTIGDGNVKGSMDVCVYSTPHGSYGITASGGAAYKLFNGIHSLSYSLYWDDSGAGQLGSSTGTQLIPNVMLPGQVNANTHSSDCASHGHEAAGPTARLTLMIAQNDMAAALSGTYSGTITLMVSPI